MSSRDYAENPLDICNFFRANGSSFHAKAAFSRESGYEKNGKPLAAFNHFSRVVITLIDKDEKQKFVEANVQYEKLPELIARGRHAIQLCLNKELTPVSEGENTSPAYTVVIASGRLKGKTPAQVMQEPDGSKLLNDQYKWLQDNLAKYPKNKVQMDAISDAARLYKEGKLEKPETNAVSGIFNILEAVPLPLIRNKKEDGTCPVREISIEADLSKNSPFQVTVSNYDAPVMAVTKNGMQEVTNEGSGGNKINVQRAGKKNECVKHFRLTIGEFAALLDHIEIAKDIFLNANAGALLKEALEADENNRKANSTPNN